MNIGTWNVRGIAGKMEEVIEEVTKLNMDIVVLTETKKKGVGVEMIQKFVHIYTGVEKHQRAKRGVSVLIHKKHQRNITNYEAVDENIIKINITLHNQSITVLGIYGISNDEPYAVKDEFYEKLNDEITKIGSSREIIILGDLNGKTGKRTGSKVVGPYGEISLSDNGERLIEVCESHKLKITNGFFKHKDIHTYTWIQSTRNLRSIIDYIIIKQNTTLQVNDVRAYRGVICGSDHNFVKSKILFPHRKIKRTELDTEKQIETITNTKYNLDSLRHESIKLLYQKRLDENLTNEFQEHTVNEVYENITNSIKKAAEEALGLWKQKSSNKLWWTEEIEDLIKEKKNAYLKWLSTKQQVDEEVYKEIKRTTRQAVTAAKRNMWDKKCQEINTYIGGRKCSETWRFINQVKATEKKNMNIELIRMEKWKTYYEDLLTENRHEYNRISPSEVVVEGEHIVVSIEEVKKSIRQLKNGRSPGPEGIPAELIKNGSEKLFEALTWCINRYLNGADVPKEWKNAYISSIHKKGNKLECTNYRGISVTSTISRLYGRIIRDLIETEYEPQEEEEQSGFRAGRSCNDNVFCLKQIIEKKSAVNQETHLMFIDLKKAYDTVPINKLWKVLQETNISQTLIKALKNLYDGSTSQIKAGNKLSQKFFVNKGLRQGCCVSPTLFKIYIAKALSLWKRKCQGMGIDLGGICLYTLQFADDQVIMANDIEDIEYMARKLQEEYRRWGLEINIQKTKYLPIGTTLSNIQLENGDTITFCNEYTYLGVIFDSTGRDDNEIKKRITQARRTIGCLNGIFWSQEIGKQRKYTIYDTLIKSSLLYGAETWRLTENNKRKLEAVEMDVLRRSLGISRRDRVRNEEVKRRMGIEESITTEIERKQLIWYGHVQRMPDTRLPKKTMEWIPPGRRKIGRPKKTWKEGVKRAMSERDLREDQCNDRLTWKLGIGQRRKTF